MQYFYEKNLTATEFVISEETAHHCINVLRMKVGDTFILTNGLGKCCTVEIILAHKKHCTVKIIAEQQEDIAMQSQFHLAIAFTKNAARMEWLLEKATEIGIGSITPLLSKRSEKTFIKRDRLENILVSAMLQSQQSFLPILHEPSSLEKIIQSDSTIKCIAHCIANEEKILLQNVLKKDTNTLLLIGPEGDFTTEEVALCTQHHFTAVSLGNTRLRTETAGLLGCVAYNLA